MISSSMDQSSDEDEGCSSRPICSSPEEEDERPLKKARYLWQIKGKHHLKTKDKLKSESSEDVSMELDVCDASESKENTVPQNLSTGTPSVPKAAEDVQESSCVQSPSEGSSMSDELLPDLFPTLNKAINRTSYLQRCWQTKQLARGMLDNTMNCMMERMGFAPLNSDQEDNDIGGGNQIEDEAVMMAIQRHGLQCSEDEIHYPPQDVSHVAVEENVCKDLSRLLFSGPSVVPPEQLTNVRGDISISEGGSTSHAVVDPVVDSHSSGQQPSALSQMEHDSFLDAAVAVAIQKKGLSVLTGTESA